jgi:predicted deacylase
MSHKRLELLLLVVVLLTAAVASLGQQPAAFTIAEVTAQAGEKTSGYLEVAKGSDEATRIPITIIHGVRPGPTITLIAGVHGAEYAPIIALQRLRSRLDAKKTAGTIVLVQVANLPSFLKRTIYYGPVDGKNLNRVFPGKADGTLSERIAFTLVDKLFRRTDYLIDIHCGDSNEALVPYVAYYTEHEDPTIVEKSKAMALAFGIEYVKAISGRSKDFNTAVYSTNASFLLGKPTMAVESGELGRTDEASVSRIEQGAFNVLRHLRMLAGVPPKHVKHVFVIRDETIRAKETGIFYPLMPRGSVVQKGAKLGYLTDFFGNRLSEIRAPFDGVVLYILGTPPVSAGEPLVSLGELAR